MNDKREFDLGVLFVHGIGDQSQGSTLVDFGTPLAEWLEGRATNAGGHLQFGETHITPSANDDFPSHAGLSLELPNSTQRWLMAESWWARSFMPPSFSDLARWGLAAAPWTFGAHFGERLRRAWRGSDSEPREVEASAATGEATRQQKQETTKFIQRTKRLAKPLKVAGAALSLLGGLFLSVGVIVVLVVLMWARTISWGRLRTMFTAMQLRIAGLLGDSYIVVAREIEFAAILSKVRSDLHWLQARCGGRVAVVAHSQGAAIACNVLAQEAEGTSLLITFGSGLRKLEQQRELRRDRRRSRAGILTISGLLLSLLIPYVITYLYTLPKWTPDVISIAGLLIAYAAVGLALLIAGMRDFAHVQVPAAMETICGRLADKRVKWNDYYATSDPVPNGAAVPGTTDGFESIPVVNLASVVRDHTNYWTNRDVFVPAIGNALLEFASAPEEMRNTADELARATIGRKRRVNVLQIGWWLAIAAAIGSAYTAHAEWRTVLGWLTSRTWSFLVSVAGIENVGPVVAPKVLPWAPTAGTAVLILLGYALFRAAWDDWNSSAMRGEGSSDFAFTLVFLVYVNLIAGVLLRRFPPLWIVLIAFVGTLALIIVADTSDVAKKTTRTPAHAEPMTMRVWSFLWSAFGAIAGVGGLVFGAVEMIDRARDFISEWVPKANRGASIFTATFLVLGALVTASALLVGLARLLIRRKRPEPMLSDREACSSN